MPRRYYSGLGPSCVRTRIPSTRRLGQHGCRFTKLYASSVRDNNFPSSLVMLTIFPVQLTTSRIGNLTRLILTLATAGTFNMPTSYQ